MVRHTIKVKVPSTAVTGDVTVTNSAGTTSAYTLTIDSTVPDVSSITINSGEQTITTLKTEALSMESSIDADLDTTTQNTVNLSIEAADAGLVSMQFANSSKGPFSTLEAYSSSKSGWTLSSGPGTKTVYVKVYDSAGNYTTKSDTIKLLPNITSISPDPASGLSSSVSNIITITGTSFGSRSSSSYVTFANGIKVSSKDSSKIPSWSDSTIKVKVPSSAVTGDVTVTNSAGQLQPILL